MAEVTVTAANVTGPSGIENIRVGTAGATITRGQLLYIDTADSNKLKLTDANASELAATIAGVALTPSTDGNPVVYAVSGDYNCGGTVTKGAVLVASATTAGSIAEESDLASGWYTSILGVASSTSNITIKIFNSGITTT